MSAVYTLDIVMKQTVIGTIVSTCHVVTILICESSRPMTRLLMCVHYLKTVNVILLLS